MRTSDRTRRNVFALSRLCLAPALAFSSLAANAAGDGFDFGGMKLPPGFTATTYISAEGFDPKQGAPGLPAIVTITFAPGGDLYFARTAKSAAGNLWLGQRAHLPPPPRPGEDHPG